MEGIIIQGITIDEFSNLINRAVDIKMNELKKDFQPKEPLVLMKPKEVYEFFNVSAQTLCSWTDSGRLTSYVIGGNVYYKRKEVEAAPKKNEKQKR